MDFNTQLIYFIYHSSQSVRKFLTESTIPWNEYSATFQFTFVLLYFIPRSFFNIRKLQYDSVPKSNIPVWTIAY
jgi:hypothetical protein